MRLSGFIRNPLTWLSLRKQHLCLGEATLIMITMVYYVVAPN